MDGCTTASVSTVKGFHAVAVRIPAGFFVGVDILGCQAIFVNSIGFSTIAAFMIFSEV
jgi:hypothetical protein